MDNLLPCPFCGETKLVRAETDFHPDRPQCNWTARVVCLNCFGKASSHGFEWTEGEAKEKAIAAWNRRTEVTPNPPKRPRAAESNAADNFIRAHAAIKAQYEALDTYLQMRGMPCKVREKETFAYRMALAALLECAERRKGAEITKKGLPGMPTPPRMPINNDEYEEWIEKGRPGKEKASERIKSEVWHND